MSFTSAMSPKKKIGSKPTSRHIRGYPASEYAELQKRYRQILRYAGGRLTPKHKVCIEKAYRLALDAHRGMHRKSGEPFGYHPLEVALICVKEMELDMTAVAAALLHDVVEDTDVELNDIRTMFGNTIASIIEGLTKISGQIEPDTSRQAENFRKILLTLAQDPRVVLIKLADRLHNMRTLSGLMKSKQIRIASETIYLYVPLAHRLGLYSIKSELEDLYLKYTEPDTYQFIAQKLSQTRKDRDRFVKHFIAPVDKRIGDAGIKSDIKGRPKSIYSIWNKMKRQNIPFEEVYDLFAIRIIIESTVEQEKALCWQAYSIITDTYQPKPDRIKDWISTPKVNGYESLHLTVMSHEGQWVEVQIRSERMNEIAEKGYAAHWKYKEQKKKKHETPIERWLLSLRELLERKDESTAIEFVKEFKANSFASEVYVFTPNGDMKILPQGATVLDFAFDVHTDIGKSCIGAKINKRLESISYVLQNGDQVEVLTSSRQRPISDWLALVCTTKARHQIRQSLKEKRKVDCIEGKTLLERKLRRLHILPEEKTILQLINHFELKSESDLYYYIKHKRIKNTDLQALKSYVRADGTLVVRKPAIRRSSAYEKPLDLSKNTSQRFIVIGEKSDQVTYQLSSCCGPILGDEVFGIMTQKDGIKIHRTTCPNAPELLAHHGERIIRAQWQSEAYDEGHYLAKIKMDGFDRRGMTRDLMQIISHEEKMNSKKVELSADNGTFKGYIEVYVPSTRQLDMLIKRLKRVKGVTLVLRLDE